jgi:hypothetical protein
VTGVAGAGSATIAVMNRLSVLALALVSILPACGGGGGDPVTVITGLARTAGCTVDGIGDYAAIVEAINDELQKTPVPSVLDVDTIVNGKAVTLSGTISEPAGDLDDGFMVGDVAEVVITNLSVDGVVTGSGNLTLNYQSETMLVLVGTVELADGSCSVNLNNINLFSDPTADGYPSGFIDFVTGLSDDTLNGQVALEGNSVATVTAFLNDGPELSFEIDLDTFEPIFD